MANAGQKYCRILQGEHSAILLTFIKVPFVIKTFVVSTFEWMLKTGFTILKIQDGSACCGAASTGTHGHFNTLKSVA